MKQILILALLLNLGYANSQIQGYNIGDTVETNFTIVDTDGQYIYLDDLFGQDQTVLLFFFNLYGQLHETVAPILQEFYEKYGCNQGDVFTLGVNYSTHDDAAVETFISTFMDSSNHFPCVSGSEGNGSGYIRNLFDPQYNPTICMITSDRVIRNLDMWPISDLAEFESYFTLEGITISPMSCVESLEAILLDDKVEVSPNPSSGEFIISLGINFSTAHVAITDLSGRGVLDQLQITSMDTSLELDQPSGVYLLHLIVDGNKTTKRIILE